MRTKMQPEIGAASFRDWEQLRRFSSGTQIVLNCSNQIPSDSNGPCEESEKSDFLDTVSCSRHSLSFFQFAEKKDDLSL